MGEDDLEAQINQESIKKISAENSVFGILFLKLCTIFKILQEFNQLA